MSEDKPVRLDQAIKSALVSRLKQIPDGRVSETARRAGMPLRQLMRLRAGENVDVRLTTFVRLAQGLGETPDDLLRYLLGEGAGAVREAPRPTYGIDERRLLRLKRVAAGVSAEAKKVVDDLDGLFPRKE